MGSLYKKTAKIYCVECGRVRVVHTPLVRRVKRCKEHQYDAKRRYNSNYVKKKRREARALRLKQTNAPKIQTP